MGRNPCVGINGGWYNFRYCRFEKVPAKIEPFDGMLHVLSTERNAICGRDLGATLVLQGIWREWRPESNFCTLWTRSLGFVWKLWKKHDHGYLWNRYQRWVESRSNFPISFLKDTSRQTRYSPSFFLSYSHSIFSLHGTISLIYTK